MTTTQPARADEPHLASPDENPSFIRGLFLGEIREGLVFPIAERTIQAKELAPSAPTDSLTPPVA